MYKLLVTIVVGDDLPMIATEVVEFSNESDAETALLQLTNQSGQDGIHYTAVPLYRLRGYGRE